MKQTTFSQLSLPLLIIGSMMFSCSHPKFPHDCNDKNIVVTTKVFATGLNNPRGLKMGPDGYLYVAEGGTGGTTYSSGCQQAPPPVGPYKGSEIASRISRINSQGVRTSYSENLPSSTAGNGAVTGMADVGFIGNTLYGLIAGGGCSHGVPNIPNGLVKATGNGKWKLVSNYSAFELSHPAAHPDAADFTPDGNPYSMVNVGNSFYVIEANSGVLDKLTPGGNIERVVDFSATLGHIVPTAVTFHDGFFYVGNLGEFPITPTSGIYRISTKGDIKLIATGFSAILSIAFDNHNQLYVLQNTVGAPGPTPGLGNVVRLDPSGQKHVVVSSLNLPTAITIGNDGKMYISNWGIGAPGTGQILQVSFECEAVWPDKSASQQ